MVQIIEERAKRPSFSQQIGGGFSKAAQMTSEHLMQQQQQQAENEAVLRVTGQDISGIRDPKVRQMLLQGKQDEQAFGRQLAGQKELQENKFGLDFENKQNLLNQKSNFLSQLFGGKENENTNPSSQNAPKSGLDASKITDDEIAIATAMDPNLGRALSHAKDVALRENRENAKNEFDKEKYQEDVRRHSPEYVREQEQTKSQAKADIDYNKKLQESAKKIAIKRESLNRLKALNKKGITGKPYEKLLEKSGLIALTSDGRREFAAEVKNQFTDFKEIAGSQLTGMEFQTLMNAYPSADFSKEANEAIINNVEIVQDTVKKELQIADQLKKENRGRIPPDFNAKVNEKLQDYIESRSSELKNNLEKVLNEQYGIPKGQTLMFDPQGEPLSVNLNDIEKYQNLGATFP